MDVPLALDAAHKVGRSLDTGRWEAPGPGVQFAGEGVVLQGPLPAPRPHMIHQDPLVGLALPPACPAVGRAQDCRPGAGPPAECTTGINYRVVFSLAPTLFWLSAEFFVLENCR